MSVVLAVVLAVSGQATWYAEAGQGHAAAGPALRHALGKNWRGKSVQVCADRCVTVRLTDWCACRGERVIDLSDEDFQRLAPLTAGVIRVTVRTLEVAPPPTDAATWGGSWPGRLPC
jgi:rare lipoprotein A (peptidoglycan hydrolase)